MAAHTRSAAWSIHRASGVYEDIHKSFRDTLLVDLLRRRYHHHTHILMYGPAFEYRRRLPHIFHAPIGTGSYHDLIDPDRLHRLDLINRLCIARKMRECHGRANLRQIDLNYLIILSVRVCLVDLIFLLRMFFHICFCDLIHREDPVLRSCLDRHICHRKSVVHRERADPLARKLHRFI